MGETGSKRNVNEVGRDRLDRTGWSHLPSMVCLEVVFDQQEAAERAWSSYSSNLSD